MSKKRLHLTLAATLTVTALTGCDVLSQLSGNPASSPTTPQSDSVVLRVIDGDTIAVEPTADLPATNDEGTEHTVRLLSIDTPEMNYTSGPPECGAQEATSNLEALLPKGTSVTITFDERADHTDRFGRSLAYVGYTNPSSQFTDAALAQASLGHAEAWFPKSEPTPERFPEYKAAAENAKAQNLGSWQTCDTLGRQG